MNDETLSLITEKLGKENVLFDEPMSKHTSFEAGGSAKYFLIPAGVEELAFVIETLTKAGEKYFVLGNGSNVLVRDEGFDGSIILVKDNFKYYRAGSNGANTIVTAAAGLSLKELSEKLLADRLGGFEFASGIPGCMGGAMAMNAGAYGGEMKDVVIGAKVIDKKGKILKLSKDELEMGYRSSAIQKNGYVLIEAYLRFRSECEEVIREKIDDYTARRQEKQPLDMPSAGSTFKRPEGYFAGKLIMDSGLKGYRHGGAMISEKHCGFVVNAGGATASDIIALITEVQDIVYEKYGVRLEPEVRII